MDRQSQPLDKVNLSGALALVVGSEAGGLRRLVREKCDLIAHIPTTGLLDSLNAAVAGSIALYAASLKRKQSENKN
jgi:23S rRNA (guanosine2251-2'-O)-methyltransferase